METIEHKGMEITAHYTAGVQGRFSGPPEDCYPSEPAEVEIEEVCVSDWDEFAEWWGANGETPVFAPSLDTLLDKLADREFDEVYEAVCDAVADDYDGEPYDIDDDSYWEDHDIYGGGSYIGGDSDLMGEW